jgi:hypothetical protein
MATIGDIASFVQRYNKTERRIKEIEDVYGNVEVYNLEERKKQLKIEKIRKNYKAI